MVRSDLEVDVDAPGLRSAYFGTRVLSPKEYASAVALLRVFAEHLTLGGAGSLMRWVQWIADRDVILTGAP